MAGRQAREGDHRKSKVRANPTRHHGRRDAPGGNGGGGAAGAAGRRADPASVGARLGLRGHGAVRSGRGGERKLLRADEHQPDGDAGRAQAGLPDALGRAAPGQERCAGREHPLPQPRVGVRGPEGSGPAREVRQGAEGGHAELEVGAVLLPARPEDGHGRERHDTVRRHNRDAVLRRVGRVRREEVHGGTNRRQQAEEAEQEEANERAAGGADQRDSAAEHPEHAAVSGAGLGVEHDHRHTGDDTHDVQHVLRAEEAEGAGTAARERGDRAAGLAGRAAREGQGKPHPAQTLEEDGGAGEDGRGAGGVQPAHPEARPGRCEPHQRQERPGAAAPVRRPLDGGRPDRAGAAGEKVPGRDEQPLGADSGPDAAQRGGDHVHGGEAEGLRLPVAAPVGRAALARRAPARGRRVEGEDEGGERTGHHRQLDAAAAAGARGRHPEVPEVGQLRPLAEDRRQRAGQVEGGVRRPVQVSGRAGEEAEDGPGATSAVGATDRREGRRAGRARAAGGDGRRRGRGAGGAGRPGADNRRQEPGEEQAPGAQESESLLQLLGRVGHVRRGRGAVTRARSKISRHKKHTHTQRGCFLPLQFTASRWILLLFSVACVEEWSNKYAASQLRENEE
uniref:Uncharacterized protein n=1 Tax=Anopheles dirus TaxID=7168 RepID=A0A182N0J3_9DIPT